MDGGFFFCLLFFFKIIFLMYAGELGWDCW